MNNEQCDEMTELTMMFCLILIMRHFIESHDRDELTDFDKFDWKSWWIINYNKFDTFDEQ